jgi:hypothetical protein
VSNTKDWDSFLKMVGEVEKTKKLESELSLLKTEYDKLYKKYFDQFDAELKKIKLDVEKMKTSYPILDLVSAKEAEVDRMKKALQTVPRNHADRKAIESMVKAHIVERDQLRRIAEEAENRFDQHLEKIETASLMAAQEQEEFVARGADWVKIPEL